MREGVIWRGKFLIMVSDEFHQVFVQSEDLVLIVQNRYNNIIGKGVEVNEN